jgi:hypothetical protein
MALLDSDSSEIYGVVKVTHEATSFMFWEEPSSASKIVKISTNTWTVIVQLLLFIFELLLSDISSYF